MSGQYVRGHWVIGGVKFFRSRYSHEANEQLLGLLPKGFYASIAELQPIAWCDRTHHVEVLKVIAGTQRDETAAYEGLLAYGQSIATDLANGALRPLLKLMTPKLLAKKLPQLWVSDHQADGRLESDIAQIEDGRLPLRMAAIGGYDHVGIATLGWVTGLLGALGCKDVKVQQTGWRLAQGSPPEMTCEVRWS